MKRGRSYFPSPIKVSELRFRMGAPIGVWLLASFLAALTTTASGEDSNSLPSCAQMPTGAVSWWRAEGDASDSAGNNNGVLAGDATYGIGHSGKSFVFDGDRDGVMVGIGTNLHLQSFTIEAWIKRASASTPSFNGNSNAALFVVGTDPGGLGLSIRSSDNRLVLGKASAASVSSDARVADTNWHHVAVTRHDRRVVFYLDGEAATAPEFDANEFTYAAPAYIGSWYNRAGLVDNSFYGSIDEVAIYDRRLSAPEILAIYEAGRAGKCPVSNRPPSCIAPAPGLLSWWRGEDNAFDSVEANHGDLVGKVAYTTGKVGKALRFEAPGSGVCVGNAVGLQLQDFSIEVWLRLANPSMPAFESNITASIFSLGGV